jgi:hypothetical protein
MDYLLLIGLSVPWGVAIFLRFLIRKQNKKLAEKDEQIEALLKKYELNPSYDCQLLLAQIMSGDGLFRIEAIDATNIFIRRR